MCAFETKGRRSGGARLRGAWACSVVVLIASYAGALHAEGDPRDQARQLATRGFEALQRKDYGAAEDLFRRADALVHAPTLLVDHARALVGLGKLVEGHEGFAQVLREGVPADAPWQWKKALESAAVELDAVERRLAWLTITVKGPDAASVEIDGKPVPPAALGVRRATNPGARRVTVHADRFLPLEKIVSLREGEELSLGLALEADPSVPPLSLHAAGPEVSVVGGAAAPKPADRTLPTVLFVASAASVAAGTVTGLMALGARSSLKKTCGGNVCVPNDDGEYSDEQHQLDRYRALGTASGVAFALGVGAALGGGAVMLFSSERDGSSAHGARGSKRATLAFGPGTLEFAGSF